MLLGIAVLLNSPAFAHDPAAGRESITPLQAQPLPDASGKQGESWYEAPRTPHLVARNASGTKSARLLVWALVDQGSPIREPLSK